MGNKSSKKTEASMAVDKRKHPLSTSCRGSTQPVARQQDDRSEWVMVLNATAYIRSGTLGNAGVMTNLATANKVSQLSEQTTRTNAVAAIVPKSNAVTHRNSNSSNAFGNQTLQRQAVTTAVEARDKLKKDKSWNDHYLSNATTVAFKSSRITPLEIKPQTPHGAKQTESQHPVRTVHRNEGKSHYPISNIKEKNTVVSHTQHNFCVNKQMGIVATSQNYNTDKIPAVTGNTITMCNSAVHKDIFEALLTANKGNDWFNTLTLKANEAKQHTTGCTGREQLYLQIEDKPQHNNIAQLGINRDGRALEGFMWGQVNRAERGRWNHFRRVCGGKYKCTMCNVSLSGQQCVIEHVWGKFHQANLDKKCVNETEEDLMWRQVANPEKFHRNYIYEIDADNKPVFYCSICEVELPFTYQNLLTHIRGRNHREEVKFQ